MGGKVLITTSSFGEASAQPLERLRAAGFEACLNPHRRKLTVAESKTLLPGVVGLIAGVETLNEEVLASADSLKVISRVGVGLDSVDMEAAKKRGIPVFNTPDAHVDAVAELAFVGLLQGMRGAWTSSRSIASGNWERGMGRLLRGKTVGIVGFGKTGRALARLLAPFKARILALDPYWDEATAAQLGATRATLEQILDQADAISLHMPGQGGALIGAAELERSSKRVVLVNTARGGLIDEQALVAFLSANTGACAVLDVFGEEPYKGPLAQLPNTILTAHVGAYVEECRADMELQAVDNLLAALGTR